MAFAASLAIATAAILALAVLVDRSLLCLVLIPALLFGFAQRERLTARSRAALAGLIAAPLVVFGAHSLRLAQTNVVEPREWDLRIFSVYGHAGAGAVNFYDVDGLRAAAPAADYSRAFTDDVLATPFPAPPPTMFLLLPFGWWSLRTTAALWYALNGVALLAAVTLLWRLFAPGSGALGFLLVAALTMTFRPMQSTIALAQWNALALLALLAFWRDQGRARAGVWLGVMPFLRPFLVLLLVHPLRRRAWRTLATAGITSAGLMALAVAAFGATTCAGYFQTWTPEFPAVVYTEAINQSLLTAMLRLTGVDPAAGSPLATPAFLAAAAALVTVTGWLLWRLPAETDWTPGLTVSLGLLLYPASVEHFSLLLLPPILSVWQRAGRAGAFGWGGVAFVTLAYTLIAVDDGHRAFFALAVVWAGLVALGVTQLRAGGAADRVTR